MQVLQKTRILPVTRGKEIYKMYVGHFQLKNEPFQNVFLCARDSLMEPSPASLFHPTPAMQ